MPATLLLADDSVTIQRVIELTFNDGDVRVIAVPDGEQAIRRIDAEAPDIVLADVGMPKVDGYGVSSHIKESAALRHIPVLLLTGAFDPIDDAKAAACKCDGVFVKPFEPQALVSRVRELLASRPPRPIASPQPQPESVVAPPVAAVRPPMVDTPPPAAPAPDFWMPEPPRPVAATANPTPAKPAPPSAPKPAHVDPSKRDLDPDLAAVQVRGDDVFELGLDELDAAFSKLDPSAPAADLEQHVASEFARDLDDLRGAPAGAAGGEQTWDTPALDAGTPLQGLPDQADLHGPSQAQAPAVQPKLEPPTPPRQAPPEWEADLRRELEQPVSEPPMAGQDFGDWDLPARPSPVPSEPLVAPSAPAARVAPPAPAAPLPSFAPPAMAAAPATEPQRAPERSSAPLAVLPPRPPASLVHSPAGTGLSPSTADAQTPSASIATVFAALLAAEQKQPAYRPAGYTPALSDAVIDEIVRRVVARMSAEAVQRVVLDTAERLVREEIDKIKANPE
jgi:CheY-like chemotaxis protein